MVIRKEGHTVQAIADGRHHESQGTSPRELRERISHRFRVGKEWVRGQAVLFSHRVSMEAGFMHGGGSRGVYGWFAPRLTALGLDGGRARLLEDPY